MVNKRLLFIGAFVALVFGGAIFFLSYRGGAEPPVEVLAARSAGGAPWERQCIGVWSTKTVADME